MARPFSARDKRALIRDVNALQRLRVGLTLDSGLDDKTVKTAHGHIDALTAILLRIAEEKPDDEKTGS